MIDVEAYPAMRDAGVEWLGAVPDHWTVASLRFRYSQVLGKMLDSKRIAGVHPVPYLRNVDVQWDRINVSSLPVMDIAPDEYDRYTLQRGDLLVCEGGEVGRSAIWNGELGICGVQKALHRLRPRSGALDTPRFLYYVLRAAAAAGVFVDGHESTIGHLTGEKLRAQRFPFPAKREQDAIVRFLDHIDMRIRRAIRAKQKLIALLNEQKRAVIHRAITRGLDPNVCLKPSGVDWLGDVPAHWRVKRLKWVTRLQRGYDLPAEARTAGPFPVVSSGGIIDSHQFARAKAPGVVLGRYGSTDAVFFLEHDYWPHNTALFVTDFQGNDPRWCYFLLGAISKADHAGKSAVPGVDRKDLFEIRVAVPPLGEQRDVVRVIEAKSGRIDELVSASNREIDLLREYRTRLIADVVTGRLDVRAAAARLADEPNDQERLDEAEFDPTAAEHELEPVEA